MTIEKEKLDALNHVLGKIEKDFGKGSIMRLGEASSMVVDCSGWPGRRPVGSRKSRADPTWRRPLRRRRCRGRRSCLLD